MNTIDRTVTPATTALRRRLLLEQLAAAGPEHFTLSIIMEANDGSYDHTMLSDWGENGYVSVLRDDKLDLFDHLVEDLRTKSCGSLACFAGHAIATERAVFKNRVTFDQAVHMYGLDPTACADSVYDNHPYAQLAETLTEGYLVEDATVEWLVSMRHLLDLIEQDVRAGWHDPQAQAQISDIAALAVPGDSGND